MKNDRYWIWLQTALGYGSEKPVAILGKYNSAKEFYEDGFKAWQQSGLFTPAECTRLKNTPLKCADKVLADCEKYHYIVLTPEDEKYPDRLLRIVNPPAALYVRGKFFDIDDEVVISLVGTRKCSSGGMRCGKLLSFRLAQAGAVVLSGTALGIDSAAHLGAMAAGGRTVAVLAHGLHYPYLRKTMPMQENIANNGFLITEYQPNEPASRYTFPQRNRILSALALGVVVVEAPKISGALITANFALEQGKDVFALPGDVMDSGYAGNIRMLQDGATAVFAPSDVLLEYVGMYPHKLDIKNAGIPLGEETLELDIPEPDDIDEYPEKEPEPPKAKPKNVHLSKVAKRLYDCFPDTVIAFDLLVEKSGMRTVEILVALTELEVNGLCRAVPGNRYEKC